MADAIQAPEDASPESQAILKELAAEGHQVDGVTPEPAKEVAKEPVKPEVEVAKVETEIKSDGSDVENKKTERQEKYVPVGKHNEERHKRQEAEARAEKAEKEATELAAKLAGSANKPTVDDIDTKATRLAEKHGIDQELAKDLLLEAVPKNTVPSELLNDVNAIKAIRAEQEALALERQQEIGFENEFASVIKEFPDLADRKEAIKQLAFSEGNTNTKLRLIALEYRHDNPPLQGKKSAETPYSGKKDGDNRVIDFSEITDEDFKKMSYQDVEQYELWRKKNNK